MDNFALGNALQTLGAGIGGSVNDYFKEQIDAAQRAQSAGLERMKLQAQQDHENAALKETHDYHQSEAALHQQSNAEAHQYHQDELSLHKQEAANTARNTNSEIADRLIKEDLDKARLSHEEGADTRNETKDSLKGIDEQYKEASVNLRQKQSELAKAQSAGGFGDQSGVKQIQADIENLTQQRDALMAQRQKVIKGDPNAQAPYTSNDASTMSGGDQGSQAFSAGILKAQQNPAAETPAPSPAPKPAGRPSRAITVNGQSLQAQQAPDGKWYVQQGGKYYQVNE